MRILKQPAENRPAQYPLERLAPPEKLLFLDIETTGFTARSSCLYMIGCAYMENGEWRIIQWFADQYEQEEEILCAFLDFSSSYSCLVHFNGNNFDLPYLQQKCSQYGLIYPFDRYEGVDIYRRLSPYKYFLKLPNCKQKTVEKFLGIEREDPFGGGELIGVYHDYVKHPTDVGFRALTQHNADDMRGMLALLPILSYYDLFNLPLNAKKVQANYYTDYDGSERMEVVMKLSLPSPLPVPVSGSAQGCYFKGTGLQGTLRVPLYQEEMKYFYSNYKDYYYLPEEDMAMHKSVASFVDRQHRVQASASTCYTRKISHYLPQWDLLFTPFFKRDYKSRDLFFELTEERKKSRKDFSLYAAHVLNMIASSY